MLRIFKYEYLGSVDLFAELEFELTKSQTEKKAKMFCILKQKITSFLPSFLMYLPISLFIETVTTHSTRQFFKNFNHFRIIWTSHHVLKV